MLYQIPGRVAADVDLSPFHVSKQRGLSRVGYTV